MIQSIEQLHLIVSLSAHFVHLIFVLECAFIEQMVTSITPVNPADMVGAVRVPVTPGTGPVTKVGVFVPPNVTVTLLLPGQSPVQKVNQYCRTMKGHFSGYFNQY